MEIINKIVENDVVFFAFIGVLVLVIIGIIISIAKDNKKPKKVSKPVVEPEYVSPKKVEHVSPKKIDPIKEQEQQMAKLELEKVVKQMEDNSEQPKEVTYEEEQEDNAIISYQELLSKVKGNYEKKEVDFDRIKNNYEKEEKLVVNEIEEPVIDDYNTSLSRESKNEKNYEPEYDLRDLFRDKSVLKAEPVKTQVHIDIPAKGSEKRFRNSEYISPVTGTDEYEGDYFKNHNNSYSILDVNPKSYEKKDDLLNIYDEKPEVIVPKEKMTPKVDKSVEEIKIDEPNIDTIEIEEPKKVEVLDDLFNNEEELNFKEFSDRIKNTDDFLSTLKDLRSKL